MVHNMKTTIRVKNERLSLVSFPAIDTGRPIHLHRGKSADVEVTVDEEGNILQPEGLQEKIERKELTLTDSSNLEKLFAGKEEVEEKPVAKPAAKKSNPKPAAEQPATEENSDPLADLKKIQ